VDFLFINKCIILLKYYLSYETKTEKDTTMLTQYPISKDARYTITQEYTGHPSANPQFVIRFCGDWVGSSQFYTSAVMRAIGYSCEQRGALVITEKK
jgi:hypothetical protein